MSKTAKMIKSMVKAKKESVMGKLGDSPYEDPMEPWSGKYNAPVKNEEVGQIDEMDKSQPSSSRGAEGLPLGKKADPVKTDKVKKDALKALEKSYKKVKEEVELDEVAAWQRKEGKSEAGGLNKKGIASYRREHPGSKLSMAVTTKPSK